MIRMLMFHFNLCVNVSFNASDIVSVSDHQSSEWLITDLRISNISNLNKNNSKHKYSLQIIWLAIRCFLNLLEIICYFSPLSAILVPLFILFLVLTAKK